MIKLFQIYLDKINISYEKLLIVTSTRVYGLGNGRDITEAVKPMPDDEQARIILEYEEFVSLLP